MNTIDKIVASRYSPARAFPPEYAGLPMRSAATSIVLAEAVKRSKGKSPGFLAKVKAWHRELIMMLQPEAPPKQLNVGRLAKASSFVVFDGIAGQVGNALNDLLPLFR